MMYAVDRQGKSEELQQSLRGLEHDAVLVLQEFNKQFINRSHVQKVDLDVDRVLGSLKCEFGCCNFK